MKNIPVANVRNFVLLGHTGSGKTSILDALLFKLGVNDRKGSPETGTSMADWTEQEKERKISIWAKPFDGIYKNAAGTQYNMVMLDTPGYADFAGQMLCAASIADAALVVVDANAGLQVGTTRSWRQCQKMNLPRGIVISGLDKENVRFDATLESLQTHWGAACLPMVLPTADGRSVVSLFDEAGLPAELAEPAAVWRAKVTEAVAEANDALLEKYLGGETLTTQEIMGGLRKAVAAGSLVPVFAVSAKTDLGLDALLAGVAEMFPSPIDHPVMVEGQPIDPSAEAPFIGFVWRSINDPFVGQLALVRLYSGMLKPDTEVYNVNRGQKERIGMIYLLNGKKQEQVASCRAGDIIAIPKLKHTVLNDTLGAPGVETLFPPIVYPNPVMSLAVTPKTQGDEDKLAQGLHRIAEEDPTLRVERNSETHELILSGMGDLQLNLAVDNMKRNQHVEVTLSTPKVAYKETINGKGEGHHKHKKQSGGRGQYGDVYLRVEPLPPGDEEWFVNAVVGGVIPHNFIPAVQKGLVEGLTRGAVAGYPVSHVKVTVYDGSYHDVDSSEVAFKIAGSKALRDALSKAKPVLLEPIMKIRVAIPDHCMGDVTGDLNHRRGRILGMDSDDGMQVITAEVPQAEVFSYSSQLRSMTGGRGSFEVEFSRMDVVPANIAQKIVAEAKKDVEEE